MRLPPNLTKEEVGGLEVPIVEGAIMEMGDSSVGTLDKRGGELFLGNLGKFLAEFKQ